jgi:hypothetical protein
MIAPWLHDPLGSDLEGLASRAGGMILSPSDLLRAHRSMNVNNARMAILGLSAILLLTAAPLRGDDRAAVSWKKNNDPQEG